MVSRGKDIDYLRRLVEMLRPSMAQGPPLSPDHDLPGRFALLRGPLAARRDAGLFPRAAPERRDRGGPGGCNRARIVALGSRPSVGPTPPHETHAAGLPAEAKDMSLDRIFTTTTTMTRLWCRPFRPEDELTADLDEPLGL